MKDNTANRKTKKLEIAEFDMALLDMSAGLVPENFEAPKYKRWAVCEWLSSKGEKYVARVTLNTLLDWEEGLLIELAYVVEFVAQEPVTKADLEAACGEVLMPVWNDASYICAFITDRFINMPLMMSPEVEAVMFVEAEDKPIDEKH